MARKKVKPEFLLIEKVTRELPVELSPEEREALKDRENQQGEEVLTLERQHEQIRADEREEARARRDAIKDARAAWSKTIDARRSGTEMREFKCELRAMIKTQTIDLVRVHDGEVVESRPMSEEERLRYLQGDMFEADSPAGDIGQTLGVLRLMPLPADEEEPESGDELPADEREALGGLPAGWPRRWVGAEWTCGDDIPLAGGDIFEVYLRIGAKGSTVDELCTAVPWLGRGHVTRSLALLLRRKIVVTEEGRWFAAVEAPEVPTEPGRNDPLPEAAEIVKPKRRRAKDTGEQAINVALGQSEGMEASV